MPISPVNSSTAIARCFRIGEVYWHIVLNTANATGKSDSCNQSLPPSIRASVEDEGHNNIVSLYTTFI